MSADPGFQPGAFQPDAFQTAGFPAVLERDLGLPIEALAGRTAIQAIRAAVLTTFKGDGPLLGYLGVGGADRIGYRPMRVVLAFPALTFFDFGTRPDSQVPLLDRLLQADMWARDLDLCELMAARVTDLLDFRAAARAGLPRLSLPHREARIEHLALTADRDDVAEEGKAARKTLEFRLMGYALRS